MRTVFVNHRDCRGRTEYRIYETVELLKQDNPDAIVADCLATAQPDDYVIADNGWIVPLINIAYIEDKTIRKLGVSYKRKKVYKYRIFHFPKYRRVFRIDKLDETTTFNYNPTNGSNITGNEIRNRANELSVRKLRWASLVILGTDMKSAMLQVYPNVRNTDKLLKRFLLNKKLMQHIKENVCINYRTYLNNIGLDAGYASEILRELLDGPGTTTMEKLKVIKYILNLHLKMDKESGAI